MKISKSRLTIVYGKSLLKIQPPISDRSREKHTRFWWTFGVIENLYYEKEIIVNSLGNIQD